MTEEETLTMAQVIAILRCPAPSGPPRRRKPRSLTECMESVTLSFGRCRRCQRLDRLYNGLCYAHYQNRNHTETPHALES